MKEILKKEGHKVSTASEAKKGIDILKKNDFEVIILDIKLPTLTGYNLSELFRDTLDKSTKIIYTSVLPRSQVKMEGANGFIQKPFDKESLLNVIKNS